MFFFKSVIFNKFLKTHLDEVMLSGGGEAGVQLNVDHNFFSLPVYNLHLFLEEILHLHCKW